MGFLAAGVGVGILIGRSSSDAPEVGHRSSGGSAEPMSDRSMDPPAEQSAEELLRAAVKAYSEGEAGRARSLADLARERAGESSELAQICNFQGVLEFEGGNHPEAIGHFLHAIRAEPENGGHYYNWAEALREDGHARAALAPMQAAVAHRPDDLLTKTKLNLLLIESGQGEVLASRINELSAEGDLSLDVAFAKAALLRLSGQSEEMETLLSSLREMVSPEVFSILMNDRVFRVKLEPAGGPDSGGAESSVDVEETAGDSAD